MVIYVNVPVALLVHVVFWIQLQKCDIFLVKVDNIGRYEPIASLTMQVDEQEPVTSLQVAAKSWKKENIDGIPKDEEEEEVDDNKDLPTGF